jgi:hypothetical protein
MKLEREKGPSRLLLGRLAAGRVAARTILVAGCI